ncbi:hypothetical protein ITP53_46020 [Nonomuraea sp. K274]|uniref:Uncharacterized protein n=1 Tax=Nonomuraea cypriaca TaxID=1187855 RepID=A0A931AM30_9ACTN|nr:hypothetical protein [Nonomuraea cypriaca]MBF8192914.1 hypothetical protein [Nonomuraea cypriaca]
MTGERDPSEDGQAPIASRKVWRAGRRFDAGTVPAALAVVITATMFVFVLGLTTQQGGRPVSWFTGGLVGCAVLMAYGMARKAPGRGTVLAIAGVVLIVFGFLALLTIGLPLLVAGVLAVIAAGLTTRR